MDIMGVAINPSRDPSSPKGCDQRDLFDCILEHLQLKLQSSPETFDFSSGYVTAYKTHMEIAGKRYNITLVQSRSGYSLTIGDSYLHDIQEFSNHKHFSDRLDQFFGQLKEVVYPIVERRRAQERRLEVDAVRKSFGLPVQEDLDAKVSHR